MPAPYRGHMGTDGVGSSVVIALAAVLWLVYLIPTWFRRREYLTTERNAVRLQQTIRIMAETADIPETVHLEADARTVAHQEKLLRQQFERDQAVLRAREAAMSRAATRTLATLTPSIASEAIRRSPAAQRLRRSRAGTTVVLLLAVLGAAASATPIAVGFAPALLGSASVLAVAAVALLTRMASVARRRAAVAAELAARPERPRRLVLAEQPAVDDRAAAGWVPVPLPKPLYLDRPVPQPVISDAMRAEERERRLDAAAEAERAAVAAERAAIAAERAEKVTPIRPAAASASRYGGMGIIDHSDTTVTDLDAVLRRRRAV